MHQYLLVQELKLVLLFLVCTVFSKSIGQENPNRNIAKGTIHASSGNTIDFVALEYRNDKVYFSHLASNKRDSLLQSDITFVKVEVKSDPTLNNSNIGKAKSQGNKTSATSAKDVKTATTTKSTINAVLESIPDGVYDSMESFINKKPDSNIGLKTRVVHYKEVYDDGYIVSFYDTIKSHKIHKKFAIKWNGGLYFSKKAIIDGARKGDRTMTSDVKGTFVRVIFSNASYYYTEADLVTEAGQVILGSFVSISGDEHIRGLVWDVKNHHFDIFRNCKDFNLFMEEQKIEPKLDCINKYYGGLVTIREVVKNHLDQTSN